jgi:Asp-tRNA(Asn)/Glu-tRNA(Gln) amidotransferase A subunit family amidase
MTCRLLLAVVVALVPAGYAALDPVILAGQTGTGATVPFDVMERSISELQAALQAGTVTSRALVEAYLARIEVYDRRGPHLNAMISLNPGAIATAEALDRERAARGPRGPLHGIPIVLKDNFDTADMPTTAGSVALSTLQPREDGFQVKKLREAGVVIIGKTNLHELAMGITTASSLGGQTRNPYDLARSPGGSSGGTGAAVAASFAAAGMGSDTCGSIRIPAANNNLVGLRGTHGLSSRKGIIPLSHTQDIGGPLARTIPDLAIMLDATVGVDPADEATRASEGRLPRGFTASLGPGALKGARIGILSALFGNTPDDEEVASIVRRAIDGMKKEGAEPLELVIPGLDDLLRDSSVIDAEFKFDFMDYLASVPNAPVRSGADILERGLFHLAIEASLRRRLAVESRESEPYRRALVKRKALREAVMAALEEHRLVAIAYPTMRRRPVLINPAEPQRGSNCQLSATTGLPALALPAGFTDDGVPIGFELLGGPFSDADLLNLGYAYEQAARLRRAPQTTPALTGVNAPAPASVQIVATATSEVPPVAGTATATARLTLNPATSELAYSLTITGVPAPEVVSTAIHRGAAGENGPALFILTGPGTLTGSGTVTLSERERTEAKAGRLYLKVHTRTQPLGAARGQIAIP